MDVTILLLLALTILSVINIGLTLRKKDSGNNGAFSQDLKKLEEHISRLDPLIRDEFMRNRDENRNSSKESREELNVSFKLLGETLARTVTNLSATQRSQFETFSGQLNELIKSYENKTRDLQIALATSAKESREEQTKTLKAFEEKLSLNIKEFNEIQKQKFDEFSVKQERVKNDTEDKLKEIRETVENKLYTLQEENNKKLDEMRKVVDEKLQETVEKRFNESFRMISERLEQVHKGLGEMQTLASGVGDLKKVLTNVKTRGNLGEIQLGAILEQILSPEQFEYNAATKENTQERVEYVIKLPGKYDDKYILLPIDSKFPNEDYQRLLDAYENTNGQNGKDLEICSRQFENSVKKNAKEIRSKYINPPITTDFAIMFVPTEGLYAEILRRTGLFECLQRDYKITVVGPTNLVAFLSSLQMGFKTLAIEKRSSEVWEILGAVKTEFGRFGIILEKTKKKLQEATNVIDQAGVRSRSIERKLKTVQQLPEDKTIALLGEIRDIEEEREPVPENIEG